jgi:hypothetical protein
MREERRHPAAADPAELDLGRSELRILRADADVAAQRSLEPPAERIAVDGCDRELCRLEHGRMHAEVGMVETRTGGGCNASKLVCPLED